MLSARLSVWTGPGKGVTARAQAGLFFLKPKAGVKVENIMVNDVIEKTVRGNGIYEIKVHPFSKENIGRYEDGIRKALKGLDEGGEIALFIDFSEENILQDLDERALFDVFQLISFNCLRYREVHVKWSHVLLEYLVNYRAGKNTMWKMSSSTINKLISIGNTPKYPGKN